MTTPHEDPVVEVVWRELRQVLDEELGRLSQKYRAPLVLFYLEGKTTGEVARQLGCPKGTVLSRLARGRDRLRKRLVRRGVALSMGVMVDVLMDKAASAAVPTALAIGTVKAAVLTAAGQTAAGAIPATVVALTKGVLRAMLLNKLKFVAAVALAGTTALGTLISVAPAEFTTKPELILFGLKRAQAPDDKPTAAGKEEASKDAEKIVGTWPIVSAERGGQKVPQEMFKDGKWIFAVDGKVTAKFRPDAKDLAATYTLDPVKKPKEITIITNDGKRQPSIYQLDGETLMICMGDEDLGTGRPTEFTTKKGSKIILFVLKREKK